MSGRFAELYPLAFGKGAGKAGREPPPPHWNPERAAAIEARGPQPADKTLAMSYGGYDLRVLKDGSCRVTDILDKDKSYAEIRFKGLCQEPEGGADIDALLALFMVPLTLLSAGDDDPRYQRAMFYLDQAARVLSGRKERDKQPEWLAKAGGDARG